MRTLEEVKTHLRIDDDEEDAVLEGFAKAADEYLASIGIDMAVDPLPQPVAQAELMMIGHWYLNREATSGREGQQKVPFAVDALTAPYRSWSL